MHSDMLSVSDNDLAQVTGGDMATATKVAAGVLCFAGGFGVGCLVVMAAITVYEMSK